MQAENDSVSAAVISARTRVGRYALGGRAGEGAAAIPITGSARSLPGQLPQLVPRGPSDARVQYAQRLRAPVSQKFRAAMSASVARADAECGATWASAERSVLLSAGRWRHGTKGGYWWRRMGRVCREAARTSGRKRVRPRLAQHDASLAFIQRGERHRQPAQAFKREHPCRETCERPWLEALHAGARANAHATATASRSIDAQHTSRSRQPTSATWSRPVALVRCSKTKHLTLAVAAGRPSATERTHPAH